MASILKVVYVSQKDSVTAGYSFNDCGPACIAMMAQTIGKDVSVDQVYRDSGITSRGPLWVSTVQSAGNKYGLKLERHDRSTDARLSALQTWIDEGRPALVLVDYKPVMRAGLHESYIGGGHFALVVGYDDNYVYIHDPYWNGDGGAYRKWPIPVFNEAWYQHNTQYQKVALVPAEGIAGLKKPPFPVPDEEWKRIRARAMFAGITTPIPQDEADYQDVKAWLGDWGAETITHIVKPGDTLGAISEEYYGSSGHYPMIALFNEISDPGRIKVGMKIDIPLPAPKPGPETPDEEPVEYDFTHQQLINAFYDVYRARNEVSKYWKTLEKVGLAYIANDRSARYAGPDLKTLPGLDTDIASAVLEKLV